MLLAELEIFHSRPIAPTRRISIGQAQLPGPRDGSAPGFGSMLLGAVCARFGAELSHERLGEVVELVHELEQGRPVSQPRLRHRLQRDKIGLTRSRQRLYGPSVGAHSELECDLDGTRATPSQLVLGAAYAASLCAHGLRQEAIRSVRRGLAWRGEVGPALFTYLAGAASSNKARLAAADPVQWALEVLGFDSDVEALPEQAVIRRGFRDALRAAHPDLGAVAAEAAERIADLSEARRILLTRA